MHVIFRRLGFFLHLFLCISSVSLGPCMSFPRSLYFSRSFFEFSLFVSITKSLLLSDLFLLILCTPLSRHSCRFLNISFSYERGQRYRGDRLESPYPCHWRALCYIVVLKAPFLSLTLSLKLTLFLLANFLFFIQKLPFRFPRWNNKIVITPPPTGVFVLTLTPRKTNKIQNLDFSSINVVTFVIFSI